MLIIEHKLNNRNSEHYGKLDYSLPETDGALCDNSQRFLAVFKCCKEPRLNCYGFFGSGSTCNKFAL